MRVCELTAQEGSKLASGCPMVSSTVSTSTPAKKADRITFGMDINHTLGCCVEKVKTGRVGGCCAHIPNEKFVEKYRKAVQKVADETGIKPELDSEVQEILDGKCKPPKSGEPEPTSSSEDRKKALSPIRWFKAMLEGFWADVKLVASGKISD